MTIYKILNNNTVVVLDKNNNEIILKGKGIAYQSRNGDLLDEKKIEKTFVLESKENRRKFQEIILSIPSDCVDTSEEIISMIKSSIDKKISDVIYVTLTDHISNLLERVKLGIVFDSTLLWNIERMYKEEYLLGKQAVDIIKSKFNINISEDEASFIALHIVNAELDVDIKQVYKITDMIDHIYKIVEEEFELVIDEDDLSYSRFILHLRFLFERLVQDKTVVKEYNKDLLEVMVEKYPQQYQCVIKIMDYLSQKCKNKLNSDELLYLLIHVIKMTSK
jgi:Transcriptional antiterminator